ncbi:hypothetical protein NIES2100_73690 [Calothrix sp. NIES-2100]|nr:hypothetical protein NIES2100_73690 [Calothrix sp. NIES-2100]
MLTPYRYKTNTGIVILLLLITIPAFFGAYVAKSLEVSHKPPTEYTSQLEGR